MGAARPLACLILCSLLAACYYGHAHSEKPLQVSLPPVPTGTALQAELDQFRSSNGFPAIAVTLVDQDKVTSAVSGERRMGGRDPVQITDAFQFGSNTKAMTATLIARLVEQHKLRWDSTLSEIFPAWHDQINPALLNVTVAQLLQHRSGLIRDLLDLDDTDLQTISTLQSGDIYVDRMNVGLWFLKRPPQFTPNTSFHYSNIGYLIAGLIAEAVGGDTYENLMTSDVFMPLHMQGRFGLPEDAGMNTVVGHTWGASGWEVSATSPYFDEPAQFHQWLGIVSAAGGAVLPLSDYGLFLREQFRGLNGQSSYLTQANMELLHTPANSQDSYGFGWVIQDASRQGLGTISMHDGSVGIYNSFALLIPKYHRAVAVVCNCDAPEVESKLIPFAEALARIPPLE